MRTNVPDLALVTEPAWFTVALSCSFVTFTLLTAVDAVTKFLMGAVIARPSAVAVTLTGTSAITVVTVNVAALVVDVTVSA